MTARRSTVRREWRVANHPAWCTIGHSILPGERVFVWQRSAWEHARLCEAHALEIHGETPPPPAAYEGEPPDSKARAAGGAADDEET